MKYQIWLITVLTLWYPSTAVFTLYMACSLQKQNFLLFTPCEILLQLFHIPRGSQTAESLLLLFLQYMWLTPYSVMLLLVLLCIRLLPYGIHFLLFLHCTRLCWNLHTAVCTLPVASACRIPLLQFLKCILLATFYILLLLFYMASGLDLAESFICCFYILCSLQLVESLS